MDDREIVAAIAAGDQDGLAEAYDQYAESLYGYCYSMLNDPDDAADAIQDTFVIADARLRGLSDPRKLRPWLYAVARNECHHRLGSAEPGLDEAADLADAADDDGHPERAELRRLVQAALDGLSPGEREVIELDLRHDLHGADLAAMLGVSRNQAHALASRARGQLEKAVGILLVARTGRRACPALDLMLEDWDGRLTVLTRKRISRHTDECDVCTARKRGALRPAARYGMAPLAAPPPELGGEVLDLCADHGPEARSYRQEVIERAGPFRPNGFPQTVRAPRQRLLALSGVAAAVGIVIAIAATGVVTVLALSGSHAPHAAGAARSSQGSAPASGPASASGEASAGVSPTVPLPTSQPAVTNAPPTAAATSAAAASAKPSPTGSATTTAASFPTPTRTTATPTPTGTRATGTASPTPTFTTPTSIPL